MTIGKRIESAMLAAGLDQTSLAACFKISPQAVQQWISGETSPRHKRLVKLAELLSVSVAWLLTGVNDKQEANNDFNINETPRVRGYLPIMNSFPVGDWKKAIANYQPIRGEIMVAVTVPINRYTFAFRVSGDAMENEFTDGDIIIVEPDLEPINKDYIMAKAGNDETFRQLWKESGEWLLKPLNDRYLNKLLGDNEIIGVVREKIKMYR